MSTAVVHNVFASQWKESDLILVVEDTEFHVHRSILMLQSPVFKAMFSGHFKEATQDKITLEGKTSADMLQFLKLLYPANMIKKPLISFTGENVLKILALADEYQAEDVLNECLEETQITEANALVILPYAIKYNTTVHLKCTNVITKNIASHKINTDLFEVDNVVKNLLFVKCSHLETITMRQHYVLIYLLEQLLQKASINTSVTTKRCSHQISVSNFAEVRKCVNCLKAYRKCFIDILPRNKHKPSATTFNYIFNALINGDDVCVALNSC